MALVPKPAYTETTDEAALAEFGCDVSFISDHSTAPEELITRAVEQASSHDLKHLFWETFDRIRNDYAVASPLLHPAAVVTRIHQACAVLRIQLSPDQHGPLLRFFNDVNEALFQQQTLAWLAADANIKLHLYGLGWERHATLARHSRGVVRDEAMRLAILRASKINLSAHPYGAVTPQLLEGVAQGAFFLMPFSAADLIEKFFPPLIDFCARGRLHSNAALAEHATPGVRELLAFASRTLNIDVLREWPDFVPHLLSLRAKPRSASAAVLWPEQYAHVCFSSRDEFLNLAGKFLYDQPQRRRLADAMRHQLAHRAPPRVSEQVTRSVAARRHLGEIAA